MSVLDTCKILMWIFFTCPISACFTSNIPAMQQNVAEGVPLWDSRDSLWILGDGSFFQRHLRQFFGHDTGALHAGTLFGILCRIFQKAGASGKLRGILAVGGGHSRHTLGCLASRGKETLHALRDGILPPDFRRWHSRDTLQDPPKIGTLLDPSMLSEVLRGIF